MDDVLAELVITVVVYICKTAYNAFQSALKKISSLVRQITGATNNDSQQVDEPHESNTENREKPGNQRSRNEERKSAPAQSTSSKQQTRGSNKKTKTIIPKSSSKTPPLTQWDRLISLFGWLIVSVPQGYIGVYKTLGVLNRQLLQPGLHVSIPGAQKVMNIPNQVETHIIENVPCGTSTGVLLTIDRIEVVSRLKLQSIYDTVKNYSLNYNEMFIKDKIPHQVNTFCSKYSVGEVSIEYFDRMDETIIEQLRVENKRWAPGIEIISIRITKPQIPESIRRNYEEMEKIKTEYLVEIERQKVLLQKQDTRIKQALIRAQSNYDVHLIDLNKKLEVKHNDYKIQMIEAEIFLQRKITETDNEFLIYEKRVEADIKILSPEYLRVLGRGCLSTNISYHLGDGQPLIAL